MALSPLSTGLFSWSHITYTIRELTVTPLEEGEEGKMRGGGRRSRQMTAQTKCGQASYYIGLLGPGQTKPLEINTDSS